MLNGDKVVLHPVRERDLVAFTAPVRGWRDIRAERLLANGEVHYDSPAAICKVPLLTLPTLT